MAKKASKAKAAKTKAKKTKAKKTFRKTAKKATRNVARKAKRPGVRGQMARATMSARPFQVTQSDRDGFFIICYNNPATGNFDLNCREISAAELNALRAGG